MPAQVSHILAAEAALRQAAPSLAEAWGLGRGGARDGCAEAGPAAWFRLGAQGPDIFYHNQRTRPSGLHYGALAHKRNYGLAVEAMVAELREAGGAVDPRLRAWLLGFATHAPVDRAIHPFVVFFSGWQSPLLPETARYRSCHPFFERLLDIDILRRREGLAIGDFDLEALLPLDACEAEAGEESEAGLSLDGALARLLVGGLRAAYPRAAGADFLVERRVRNALLDARYFLRVTNPARTSRGSDSLLPWFDDRSGWRSMALIYPAELPAGLDVGNESKAPWSHPAGDGRESRASHEELFEEAVEGAARAIGLLLPALEERLGRPGLATALGNGGLSVTDGDGIPVPPRLSRPLPLKEVMEAEFAARVEAERLRNQRRAAELRS